MTDRIINRRDLITTRHQFAAAGITLFFWGALLYLWQPLIAAIAWVFEIKLFYDQMIVLGGLQSLRHELVLYLIVIIVMGLALLLWARINLWRFRGRERRQGGPETTTAETAAHFGVNEDELAQWRQARRLTVHFDADGAIAEVVTTPGQSDRDQPV